MATNPTWQDKPTCAGRWIYAADNDYPSYVVITDGAGLDWENGRWYGPIPGDNPAPPAEEGVEWKTGPIFAKIGRFAMFIDRDFYWRVMDGQTILKQAPADSLELAQSAAISAARKLQEGEGE